MAGKLGGAAQFTYDFGIMISQSTVEKVAKLTGATLTLAGAFYTLQQTGEEYAKTLKQNELRFGGMIATMRQMDAAQDRLVKGISYDSISDQLDAMNNLMAAGIKVGKNFEWISKAAHATGQSVAQFSGAVRSAVGGNMGQLVDMGLITERATRMFDKFGANTVMRQQAVTNFLLRNKAIANAIKNDFFTIGDEMTRMKAIISDVFLNIAGKPNDPNSWYHSVVVSLKNVADVFSNNIKEIRGYAKGIGIVLAYFARQTGKMMVWLANVGKKVTRMLLGSSDNFADRMRSFVVWLEFWRIYIIDILKSVWKWMDNFYHEHETLVKGIGKVLLAYLAWNTAWKIMTKGTLVLQGMIFGVKGLRTAIIAAGGAWTYFSKMMTVGLFKSAGNRSFFRMFGLTPYKVNTKFLTLGSGASAAFSKGFSAIGPAMAKTWAATTAIMSIGWSGMIKFMTATAKLPFLALSKWFKFSFLLWNSPMAAITMIGNGLKWVIGLVPRLLGLFGGLGAALEAINPIGWIMIAITLTVILYNKFDWFRKLINTMIAAWLEQLRTTWNVINFIWVILQVAVKWLWKGIVNIYDFIVNLFKYIWNGIKISWKFFKWFARPIANFFEKVVGWIKSMWKAFMNSAVGRWIEKIIINPLKWIIDNLGAVWTKLANFFGSSATSIAKSQGVSSFAWNTPNTATSVDNFVNNMAGGVTSSLNTLKGNMGFGGMTNTIPNIDLSNYAGKDGNNIPSSAPITNTMTVSSGAVQINVTNTGNGEINEEKLAKQVRSILSDMERDYRVRGGNMSSKF